MNFVELFAVITIFFSVIAAVKRNYLTWIFAFLSLVLYSIVFYQSKLYGNLILQFLYTIQTAYGIMYWREDTTPKKVTVEPISYTLTSLFYLLLSFVCVNIPLYFILVYSKSEHIFFDVITTWLSLVANHLLAKKKIENWIFWSVANIFYIILFWQTNMTMSLVLYIIFFIVSFKGLLIWIKILTTKNESI